MNISNNLNVSGYKAVKRTGNPDQDAQSFAQANNISLNEAKSILQAKFGNPTVQENNNSSKYGSFLNPTQDESVQLDPNVAMNFAEIERFIANLSSDGYNFSAKNNDAIQMANKNDRPVFAFSQGDIASNGPKRPGDYDPTQEGQAQMGQDGPRRPGDYDPTQEGQAQMGQDGPRRPGDYDPTQEGIIFTEENSEEISSDERSAYLTELESAGFSEEAINQLINYDDDSLLQQEAREKGIQIPER